MCGVKVHCTNFAVEIYMKKFLHYVEKCILCTTTCGRKVHGPHLQLKHYVIPSEGAKCSNDHNLLADLLCFSQTSYIYQNKCCLVTNKWRLNNIVLQIVTMFSTMLQV